MFVSLNSRLKSKKEEDRVQDTQFALVPRSAVTHPPHNSHLPPASSKVQAQLHLLLARSNKLDSLHPGGNPGANLNSISNRCHPILVACVRDLTKETIN